MAKTLDQQRQDAEAEVQRAEAALAEAHAQHDAVALAAKDVESKAQDAMAQQSATMKAYRATFLRAKNLKTADGEIAPELIEAISRDVGLPPEPPREAYYRRNDNLLTLAAHAIIMWHETHDPELLRLKEEHERLRVALVEARDVRWHAERPIADAARGLSTARAALNLVNEKIAKRDNRSDGDTYLAMRKQLDAIISNPASFRWPR